MTKRRIIAGLLGVCLVASIALPCFADKGKKPNLAGAKNVQNIGVATTVENGKKVKVNVCSADVKAINAHQPGVGESCPRSACQGRTPNGVLRNGTYVAGHAPCKCHIEYMCGLAN